MEIDLKPFVLALKRKDTKKAREWLEGKKAEVGPRDEFSTGYFLALDGMVSALESPQELSVVKRLVNREIDGKGIEKMIDDLKDQLSLKFKPDDERGFNTVWLEVLQLFSSL